jgi:hypothetical protein
VTWTRVWVFVVWTKLKWEFGWKYDLMNEVMWGSGLAKNAKKKGWLVIMKFRGCCYSAIFFMFLWLFVVCKWWVLFCILHDLKDVWHWSVWCFVLLLDMVHYEGWTLPYKEELLMLRSQVFRLNIVCF